MNALSHEQIALDIKAGDADAERLLVEQFERPVKLILMKRTRDSQLSSDLAQDTFILTIQKLRAGDLRNPAALPGFIRQIAVNLSIEHFRKEKRYVSSDDGIISLHATHRDQKAEQMDRRQVREMLEEVLSQLAQPRDREILTRFYLLDEDKPNICSALDLSAAHFDRVLYRAKQRMRDLMATRQDLKSLLLGGLFDG